MSGRVLVEDHCLSNKGGGIKFYTQALLHHWPHDAPLQIVGFRHHGRPATASPKATPAPPRLRPLRHLLQDQGPPRDHGRRSDLLLRGYRAAFTLEARFKNYAAVFQPNNLCPSSSLPMIATLHDLSVLEHPQWHPPGRVERWKRYLPAAIKRTAHWVTVSDFTRDRMLHLLGVPAERITVIPNAARMLPPATERPPGFPEHYLLSVGTLEPRKNLNLLLNAFGLLPPDMRRAHPLILAGPPGWGHRDFWQSLVHHPLADEVLITGYLSDSDLAAAIGHAAALFQPSFYEGFGLPLLEAMAAGCPVVCSDIAPFCEVASGAAELLPLNDLPAWATHMQAAILGGVWRDRLIARGRERATQFSWDTSARRHAQLFAEVVERCGARP